MNLERKKSTIDNKITSLNSQLQKEGDEVLVPVSKKAKISKEKEEDNEEDNEEEEEKEDEEEDEEEEDK